MFTFSHFHIEKRSNIPPISQKSISDPKLGGHKAGVAVNHRKIAAKGDHYDDDADFEVGEESEEFGSGKAKAARRMGPALFIKKKPTAEDNAPGSPLSEGEESNERIGDLPMHSRRPKPLPIYPSDASESKAPPTNHKQPIRVGGGLGAVPLVSNRVLRQPAPGRGRGVVSNEARWMEGGAMAVEEDSGIGKCGSSPRGHRDRSKKGGGGYESKFDREHNKYDSKYEDMDHCDDNLDEVSESQDYLNDDHSIMSDASNENANSPSAVGVEGNRSKSRRQKNIALGKLKQKMNRAESDKDIPIDAPIPVPIAARPTADVVVSMPAPSGIAGPSFNGPRASKVKPAPQRYPCFITSP
jgi:hypothetical protein